MRYLQLKIQHPILSSSLTQEMYDLILEENLLIHISKVKFLRILLIVHNHKNNTLKYQIIPISILIAKENDLHSNS